MTNSWFRRTVEVIATTCQSRTSLALARAARALLAVIGSAGLAQAQGVRIVEPSGGSNFPDIQAAVDAASDGNVLLVGAGTYPGFTIDGKSLILVALPQGAANVQGTVFVQGLAPHQEVALVGFNVSATPSTAASALLASNNLGDLLLQACTLTASGPGATPGVDLIASSSVALVRCTAKGADSSLGGSFPLNLGGDGVRSTASRLAVYDSTMLGGKGGPTCEMLITGGGWGYLGAQASLLFVSGSTARGGDGGDSCTCDTWPGFGGSGFVVSEFSQLHLLDSVATSGQGGVDACGMGRGAWPPFLNWKGNLVFYPGLARKLGPTEALISDQSQWSLSITGASGDRVYLPGGRALGFSLSPNARGVWLVALPTGDTPLLGVVPGSGVLAAQKFLPDVPLPLTHRTSFSQLLASATTSQRFLGSPSVRVVLNREAGPDCNANGIQDYVEILEGLVPDLNHNLIPDTCPGG